MKQCIQIILLLAITIPVAQSVQAQQEESRSQYTRPAWVPDKGFWVTENTKSAPHQTIVYYYLDNNLLIYQETINGKLKTNRDKVKMQLKQRLQQAVTAWDNGHLLPDSIQMAQNAPGNKHILAAAPGSR